MVLLFLVISYQLPHLLVSLFGPKSIEETYIHMFYLHLGKQYRKINFKEMSNEEDESMFRLLRFIVQNLLGPNQDWVAEQYLTRSAWEAAVKAEYGEPTKNTDVERLNKAWDKHVISNKIILWDFIIRPDTDTTELQIEIQDEDETIEEDFSLEEPFEACPICQKSLEDNIKTLRCLIHFKNFHFSHQFGGH